MPINGLTSKSVKRINFRFGERKKPPLHFDANIYTDKAYMDLPTYSLFSLSSKYHGNGNKLISFVWKGGLYNLEDGDRANNSGWV